MRDLYCGVDRINNWNNRFLLLSQKNSTIRITIGDFSRTKVISQNMSNINWCSFCNPSSISKQNSYTKNRMRQNLAEMSFNQAFELLFSIGADIPKVNGAIDEKWRDFIEFCADRNFIARIAFPNLSDTRQALSGWIPEETTGNREAIPSMDYGVPVCGASFELAGPPHRRAADIHFPLLLGDGSSQEFSLSLMENSKGELCQMDPTLVVIPTF